MYKAALCIYVLETLGFVWLCPKMLIGIGHLNGFLGNYRELRSDIDVLGRMVSAFFAFN